MTRRPSKLPSICPDCGAKFVRLDYRIGRCPDCAPADAAERGTTDQRGYDYRWQVISKRARRLQPFCSDCGTTDDLTTDHTPQAWQRRAAGLPIRIKDVDVICRPCNNRRGNARGDNPRWSRKIPKRYVGPCPICCGRVDLTRAGIIVKHSDTIGKICPMSGQPYPAIRLHR